MDDATPTKDSASETYGFNTTAEAELIAKVREIRPILQRNIRGDEALRNLSAETQEALASVPGIWSMALPRRWGGLGCSAVTSARVSAELGRSNPCAAWVIQIVGGTTWVSSLAADEVQETLFANGPVKICGAYMPPGVAIPVEGGYRVSGKFPYASGSKIAQWYQWGGVVKNEDGTTTPGNFAYVPMSEVTLEDSWFTAGLQGTGSDTAVIKDAFVPHNLFVPTTRGYGVRYPGKAHCTEPSDYWPQIAFVHRSAVGQLVGMGEAMLDLVREGASSKGIVMTVFSKQADSSVFQRDLAEAGLKIETARTLLEKFCAEIDAAALGKVMLPAVDRARNKAEAAFCVQLLSEAIDKLMYLAGSSAFNDANLLSWYWRHFNVAARHLANIPNVGYEVYGREMLGVEPNIIAPFMI